VKNIMQWDNVNKNHFTITMLDLSLEEN